ncbi:MAG: hypothetical protein ACOX5R_08265 [bacterium]|jgi:hypothetical protein
MRVFKLKMDKIDYLRRYMEGELSPEEKLFVEQQMETSADWAKSYRSLNLQIQGLRQLPRQTPPLRVWDNISRQIQQEPQSPAWYRWFDFNLYRLAPGYSIPAVLVAMLLSWSAWTTMLNDPGYYLISLEDGSVFSTEAENYIALHDLTGEPSLSRETLMAIYTYEWDE